MNVKWIGTNLGTASRREEVDGGFIQFPDFKPSRAVRGIIGAGFCQKIKQAGKCPAEMQVTLICDPKTGIIEIWVQSEFKKRPEKARFHSREILQIKTK